MLCRDNIAQEDTCISGCLPTVMLIGAGKAFVLGGIRMH